MVYVLSRIWWQGEGEPTVPLVSKSLWEALPKTAYTNWHGWFFFFSALELTSQTQMKRFDVIIFLWQALPYTQLTIIHWKETNMMILNLPNLSNPNPFTPWFSLWSLASWHLNTSKRFKRFAFQEWKAGHLGHDFDKRRYWYDYWHCLRDSGCLDLCDCPIFQIGGQKHMWEMRRGGAGRYVVS